MTAYYKQQSIFSQLNKNSKTKTKHSRPYIGQYQSILNWCYVFSEAWIIRLQSQPPYFQYDQ